MEKYFILAKNQGITSVTMDQLAEALGISKKTIYQHFSSKEEIIEACIEKKFAEIDQEIYPYFEQNGQPFWKRLKQITKVVAKSLQDLSAFHVADLEKTYPHLYAKILSNRRERIQRYEKLFMEGMEQKEIKNWNPKMLVEMYLTMLEKCTSPKFLHTYDLSWSEAVEWVNQLFVEGIRLQDRSDSDGTNAEQ